MRVSTQVRLVHWSFTAATVLLAVDAALSEAALLHLNRQHFRMIAEAQVVQVHADLFSSLAVAVVSVVVLAAIAVFMRRRSNKVRVAVWIAAPIIALTTLCFLVGGPEWAVAPTGGEPAPLLAEYKEAVPSWYTAPHGVAGLVAVALLLFVSAFMFRADVGEYYAEGAYDDSRPYKSWVDRTGGP
ncbi:DUF3413 domain-containing protein [Dactylosporangium sp. NPDC048998]|uniref:DUF3413 domain-containing protein n=1 Tax=Dactylosporangium sp. NPDC048998 TaxID=3363976 RepID=UPI003713AAB8